MLLYMYVCIIHGKSMVAWDVVDMSWDFFSLSSRKYLLCSAMLRPCVMKLASFGRGV